MYCYYCMKETTEQNGVCLCCGKEFVKEPNRKYLQPGTVLKERYIVGNVLGSGGFGITYAGKDQTLDTRIAIKEYFPSHYASRDTLNSDRVVLNDGPQIEFFKREKRRFLTEARTLAKFNSESNIVHARDCFELNDTVYIVMEYVEGDDLRHYVKKYGNIQPEKLVNWFLPILRVLGKVHEQGLIHRDISPDNIIVNDNNLVLIDFGAARRVIDDKTRSVTMKKGYTPPEQYVENCEPGPWMDIYAVCATMYRCITGNIPPESVERMQKDTLQKPSDLNIPIPAHIENAIMHGLSVKYRERPQTISELIAELTGEVPSPVPEYDPDTVIMDDPDTVLMEAAQSSSDGQNHMEISPISDREPTETGEPTKKLTETDESTGSRKKPLLAVILTAGAACAALAAGLGILHFARAARENSAAAEFSSRIEEVSSLPESSAAAESDAAAETASAVQAADITGKYLFRNYLTDEYISYLPETGGLALNVFESDPECVMEITMSPEREARYISPVQSNTVLNPASAHPADGDAVNFYSQNTDGTQFWVFEKSADGSMYVIRSFQEKDLVLTAGGSGLHLEPYSAKKEQCWILARYRAADESTAAESSSAESSTAGKNDKDKTGSSASESSRRSESSAQSGGSVQRPSTKQNDPEPAQQPQQPQQTPDPEPQQTPDPPEIKSDYYFEDYGSGVMITGMKTGMKQLDIPGYIGDKPVVAIGNGAFESNAGIESVTMPDSIETIGDNAFADCTSLWSVSFSGSLRSIGAYAFSNTGLYDVQLPGSLREICEGAFYGNSGIEQIIIPNGVETIGDYAFGQCDMLEQIYIPVTVNSIGVNGFKSDPPTPHHVEFGGSSAEWEMKNYSKSAFALNWDDPDIYYNVPQEWAFE